ncbi:hypothetical protein CAAN1_11S02036 [[Candida] anglica]|uniref:Uncharacterized protein n=1 Tax=[Candida] anglica TaxID=148631 RepID=A0ABP0EMN6_9ASCO
MIFRKLRKSKNPSNKCRIDENEGEIAANYTRDRRSNVDITEITYNELDIAAMREANMRYSEESRRRENRRRRRRARQQRSAPTPAPAPTPQPPSEPTPRDEYNTIDEEIPPYNVTLHKYLDRISFDPRFAPCLRINRRLVQSEGDLQTSIDDFNSFNLLPTSIDLWTISHIDDLEYDDMIPNLIQIEEDDNYDEFHTADIESFSSYDAVDRAIIYSLLESEFYNMVPTEPPTYSY